MMIKPPSATKPAQTMIPIRIGILTRRNALLMYCSTSEQTLLTRAPQSGLGVLALMVSSLPNALSPHKLAFVDSCIQRLTLILTTGAEVRAGFVASSNQKYLGTTPETKLNRDSQISMIEDTSPTPAPNPKPRGWKSWQADHVLDLGIFTTLAAQERPDGIVEDTWQTVKDAILGEESVPVLRMLSITLLIIFRTILRSHNKTQRIWREK